MEATKQLFTLLGACTKNADILKSCLIEQIKYLMSYVSQEKGEESPQVDDYSEQALYKESIPELFAIITRYKETIRAGKLLYKKIKTSDLKKLRQLKIPDFKNIYSIHSFIYQLESLPENRNNLTNIIEDNPFVFFDSDTVKSLKDDFDEQINYKAAVKMLNEQRRYYILDVAEEEILWKKEEEERKRKKTEEEAKRKQDSYSYMIAIGRLLTLLISVLVIVYVEFQFLFIFWYIVTYFFIWANLDNNVNTEALERWSKKTSLKKITGFVFYFILVPLTPLVFGLLLQDLIEANSLWIFPYLVGNPIISIAFFTLGQSLLE